MSICFQIYHTRKNVMVEKIWRLECGTLDIDQSALLFGYGYGNTLQIPVSAFLIKTERGYGLVDTGQNTLGLDDPEGIWGERAKVFVPGLTREDDIASRLYDLGVAPGEIGWVINTHLHWDHTGGSRHFKNAKFYVQKAEYRFALYPDCFYSASYMRNHFGVIDNFHLLEGDCELFPGIWVLSTPGHTAGHQSVLLKMNTGKYILLPGDAIYGEENIRMNLQPGNCWNGPQAHSSMHKLLSIRSITSAAIVTSHEYNREYYNQANEYLQRFNVCSQVSKI